MIRTDFADLDLPLPGRHEGKVRISWPLAPVEAGPARRLIVTTDRLSVFDRVVATVPHKGQVLNELSAWWFEQLDDPLERHRADHHLLSVPDPNVMIVRAARPLPVEVVVRGHITGVTDTSLWRRYEAGQRLIDGHRLPDGLHKNDALPRPIITPTTKAVAGGHDEPVSCTEVVTRGLVTAALWEQVQTAALAVFAHGVATGAAAGALLADTKYEFGLDETGELLLIDEVHTPDSSRWWAVESFDERMSAGAEPESLDKEAVRQAYADLGYRGEGAIPELDPAVWSTTSVRYRSLFERLTGQRFQPAASPVPERIIARLSEAGLL